MAREITLACLFQVLGWCVLFALCLFRSGVWQKWCQTRQAVSIPTYILDDGTWEVRQQPRHKFSVMAMQNFLAAMRRQTAPIDQQLNQLMQAQIDENREKMKSIVKTVIFCGQNNIPLRGKRDDNPDDSNLQGNFQALLEFRIDIGDVKLKEHLENAPRNATYRSKTIQNEIIETVGELYFFKDHRGS